MGVVTVGPGGLDQLGAQVGVAGLGDPASPRGVAGGVLAGGEPDEAHEVAGRREPSPVSDLGGHRQRAEVGEPAVGAETGDLPAERVPFEPQRQIGLDGVDRRLTGLHRGAVVGERRGQRRVVEVSARRASVDA